MRKYIFCIVVVFLFMVFCAMTSYKTYTSPYLTSLPYFAIVSLGQTFINILSAWQLSLLLKEYLKNAK